MRGNDASPRKMCGKILLAFRQALALLPSVRRLERPASLCRDGGSMGDRATMQGSIDLHRALDAFQHRALYM